MNVGEKIWLHCERCELNSEHKVLYTDEREETRNEDSEWELHHTLTRGLVECVQCAWPKVHVRVFTFPLESTDNFSIPAEPAQPFPNWAKQLPEDMRQLLVEVHASFTAKRYWLVAMGCRTLIDMYAVEKVGDVGGFEKKLSRLETEGYLSSKDRLVIDQPLEVGHEATHRRQAPTKKQCEAVLAIVEHLIQKLVLGVHTETLNIASAKKVRSSKL